MSPARTPARTPDLSVEPSLGELVGTATRDLSELMRKEVQLAKLEIGQEVAQAGKGAGLLGGAGAAGALGLVFLSVALAYALGRVMPLGAGFAVVGVLYLAAAGALGLRGKKDLTGISAPEKTVETLKDDLDWAKHPTRT